MPKTALTLLIPLVLTACAGPTTFRGERCEVTAPPQVDPYLVVLVVWTADHLSRGAAKILSMPVLDHVREEVSDQRFLDSEGVAFGEAFLGPPPRVRLGGVCLEVRDLIGRAVAHELAHIHLRSLDPDLPHVIEEGLAEYIGFYFSSVGFSAELENSPAVEPWPELLEMSYEELEALPKEESLRVRRAGLELVLRIGFQNLVGMLDERERLQRALEAELCKASRAAPAG